MAEATEAQPSAMDTKDKKTNKLYGQISKFAAVGVLNTIIDLGIVNVLILYFGFDSILANVIGVTAAIINSYIWNKKWTFQDKQKDVAQQFAIFLFLSIIGIILNTAVFVFLFEKWTLTGEFAFTIVRFISLDGIFKHDFVLLNWAKAWSLAFSMIWNFVAYRKWTFKS